MRKLRFAESYCSLSDLDRRADGLGRFEIQQLRQSSRRQRMMRAEEQRFEGLEIDGTGHGR